MPWPASKLVIIKPGALGDTLLLAPALRALRASMPELRVTVVGSAPAIDLLIHLGVADEVVAIDRLNLFAPSAAEHGVMSDALVLTFMPLDDEVSRRLVEIARPVRIISRSLRVMHPVRHMAVHLHRCLRACFPQIGNLNMAPFHCSGAKLDRPSAPFAILAPGAGAAAKRAPMALFSDAARKMAHRGIRPIFIAGEVEIDKGVIHHYPAAYPCRLNPDLKQLAVLLQHADAVFANDSGPAHLAGLLGADTTVFFGPSDPAIWKPWGQRVSIVKF